jgi:hypothetical protein
MKREAGDVYCAVRIHTESVLNLAVRPHAVDAERVAFIKKDFVIHAGTIVEDGCVFDWVHATAFDTFSS